MTKIHEIWSFWLNQMSRIQWFWLNQNDWNPWSFWPNQDNHLWSSFLMSFLSCFDWNKWPKSIKSSCTFIFLYFIFTWHLTIIFTHFFNKSKPWTELNHQNSGFDWTKWLESGHFDWVKQPKSSFWLNQTTGIHEIWSFWLK